MGLLNIFLARAQFAGGITTVAPVAEDDTPAAVEQDSNKKNKKIKIPSRTKSSDKSPLLEDLKGIIDPAKKIYSSEQGQLLRKVLAAGALFMLYTSGHAFFNYSHKMAEALSNPSIMFKAQLRTGETIIIDDYREAYHWLRDETPEDSRVMSWWDYGYQITGIANRTTIADGNTWNHEHIALLGKCLTGPEKESHRIIRHLADYVLIWAGGGGDDLAKSPHMARIANSVYSDICPGDPTCRR